jgi:vacuolar-type H+-ATPase subunit H
MTRRRRVSVPSGASVPVSVLEQLLDAERRAAERLTEADVEAARIVEEARADVTAADERATHALDEELASMTREAEADRAAAVAAIVRNATGEAERYDTMAVDGAVTRLVDALLREAQSAP